MPAKPLNAYDTYYDNILNAVLQADGVVDNNDCHQFTMLFPSFSAIDLHDSVIGRLVPCKFDHWSNELEYFDASLSSTIKINLTTGVRSTHSHSTVQITSQQNKTPPSQQNWGWNTKDEEKKTNTSQSPFKPGTILFHKTSRTKWVFDCIDNTTRHPVLRSFYDKSKAMQVLEKDFEEFEEIFF